MANNRIITIGRQFGSGGTSVAKVLGEKLGITVYDGKMVSEAASKCGFSPSMFRRNDEKKGLFRIFASKSMIGQDDLFRIQSDTIRDIAKKGDAIFVGRVSDYVLRDMDTLDVFITSSMEARKERVALRLGVSLEEAAKIIPKKDSDRRNYYNFYSFGDNWGTAANYDLCIDSSILGIEKTAEIILEFGRRKGIL